MSRENAVIRYLEDNGPAPKDELPREPGRTDRRGGVASFKPFHLSYTTVFYLFEHHSPAEVVDVYIETNPEVLEDRSMQELIPAVGDYGSDWKAAITEVLDDNDRLEAPWQATDDGTQTNSEEGDTQPEPGEIEPPTGPFVWWGRQVGRVVAPRTGMGRSDIVGGQISMTHIIMAVTVAAVLDAYLASVGIVLVGFLAAVRYGSNMNARQQKMIQQLKDDNPDMEVHRI